MTDSTFYTKVWEYQGFNLVSRPDSPNLYINWYDEHAQTTRNKSTRTSDLGRAQSMLMDHYETVVRRGRPHVPDSHEVRLSDAFDYYLDRKITPENRSRDITERCIASFMVFARAHDLSVLSDLHPDTMDEYREFREILYIENQVRRYRRYESFQSASDEEIVDRIRPLSPATIARELAVVRAALNFYRKRQRVRSVPFIHVPSTCTTRTRWLTPAELDRLLDCVAEDHVRDYVLLAIYTLQRPSFLCQLHTDQVDLLNGHIHFQTTGTVQTRKRRPSIRIADRLMPVLQRLISTSNTGYLLEYQGRPIQNIRKAITAAAEKAGLNDADTPMHARVVPYTLRHTGATWLAQAGIDLWQIAGMLGHRDLKMVTRVYAKHHPDFQTQATQVLDAMVPVHDRRASFEPEARSKDYTLMSKSVRIPQVSWTAAGAAGENRTPDLVITKEAEPSEPATSDRFYSSDTD